MIVSIFIQNPSSIDSSSPATTNAIIFSSSSSSSSSSSATTVLILKKQKKTFNTSLGVVPIRASCYLIASAKTTISHTHVHVKRQNNNNKKKCGSQRDSAAADVAAGRGPRDGLRLDHINAS